MTREGQTAVNWEKNVLLWFRDCDITVAYCSLLIAHSVTHSAAIVMANYYNFLKNYC